MEKFEKTKRLKEMLAKIAATRDQSREWVAQASVVACQK